jgi:cytochrome c-type biogenesis protein CcmH
MILWIILAVMTVMAVLVVLVPLSRRREGDEAPVVSDASDTAVYKDQLKEVKSDFDRGLLAKSEAESARAEVARRLLKAAGSVDGEVNSAKNSSALVRKLASGFTLVGIPAFALGLYLLYGTPGLPNQPFAERQAPDPTTSVAEADTTKLLIARAEEHLKNNPDDVRGWEILAPIYTRLRRFSDASYALKKVMTLSGGAPKATADYGESLILGNRGEVPPQALEVFNRLLETNPTMPRPLHYIALADAQAGRLKQAAKKWRALLISNPQDAPWRADIERLAAQAEKETIAPGSSTPVPQSAGTVNAPPASQLPALSNEQLNAGNSMDAGARQRMIVAMVQRLSDRLAKNGGSIEEWINLASTQNVLGKTAKANAALASAETAFAANPKALEQLKNARTQLGLGGAVTATAPTPSPSANSQVANLPQDSRAPALDAEQMKAGRSMDAKSRQQMIVSMVKRLSDRLAENGGSIGEWIRLARTQKVLGNNADAKAALASAEVAYADKPQALEQLKNARLQLGIER